MNVLIVGAGPTGLTAAVELARLGVIPTVIDARTEPNGLSRAVGITPSSLNILAPSGVTAKLLLAGPPLKGICGYYESDHLLSLNFKEFAEQIDQYVYKTPLHCLPQDQTESILTERFIELGGFIEYGNKFLALEQFKQGVTVTTSQGSSNYDHVVAADGSGSGIRKYLQIEFVGHDLPELWSVADVETRNWKHPLEFCAFTMSDGRVCVAAPIGDNRVRLVSNTEDALKNLPIPIEAIQIHRESTFTISIRQAEVFSKDRVYLAGDAAHCHSPVGGRGMNLGIADAAQLAACLVNNNRHNYHDLRHGQVKNTIAMTERGRRMLTSNSIVSRFLKPAALKLLNTSTFLQRQMILSAFEE